MIKTKLFKKLMGIMCIGTCLLSSFTVASAYSDTAKANLPNTSYYVQSNVWQSNTYFWESHSFKVSAKLYTSSACSTTAKASTIKTSWAFTPSGIGVSCKAVSAGTTNSNGFSGSWTNTNAWISDMSGTFKISGAPLYSSFTNTAFVMKSGVKATATADCFRFY